MDVRSLNRLVERAEAIVTGVRALDIGDGNVQIPEVPLPLSLEAIEEWLQGAEECCRKPKVAKSKQLLAAEGISAAAISAAVLKDPDSLADIIQRVKTFPEMLQTAILDSLAGALTKGFDDAEEVVRIFAGASQAMKGLARVPDNCSWLSPMVAGEIAKNPRLGKNIVDVANEVIRQCNVVERYKVEVKPYQSLEDAKVALAQLCRAIQEYTQILAAEGVQDARVSIEGLCVSEAMNALSLATTNLRGEKARLIREAEALQKQLELLGVEYDQTPLTVATLRQAIVDLNKMLDSKRQEFRSSLGSRVFQVVEALAVGTLPSPDQVKDSELGKAIRKAVECGYRIHLEIPHEDE
jgi:hypothetical protein